jgi:tetratricopeptide (TPR) repeat protein
MKWLRFLLPGRPRVAPKAAPGLAPGLAPEVAIDLKAAVGIDYLLARARQPVPTAAVPALRETNPCPRDADVPVEVSSWEPLHQQAEQARAIGAWETAESLWRTMRTRFPHISYGYLGGADAQCALERYEEAGHLLADAAVRFPRERAIPLARGRLAMQLADWPAAETHWRTALTFDVRPWCVYTELAGALEQQGRLLDAEAVLIDAQVHAAEPNEITLFTYPAQLAWKRGDRLTAAAHWVEAIRRLPQNTELPGWEPLRQQAEQAETDGAWETAELLWRIIRTGFPHNWHGYVRGADAQCALKRFEEAEHLLADAAMRFPHQRAIPLARGRLAMQLADWPAAESHWRTALTFDVRSWWVYTELAGALERQGRLLDAEAVLMDAQVHASEPNEITLFTYPAQLAGKRGDWATSTARWVKARRRFPQNMELPARQYEALMRWAEQDPVAYEAALRDPGLEASDEDKRALMMRFESLGGTGPDGGCEFGFFQRQFGAEPLGLFRWAMVPLSSLIDCLTSRFAGIGEIDKITIAANGGQWEITDTVYDTKMHSFVPVNEVSHDRMIVTASKRMRYLRDKLIADLENPEKIFVLKSAWKPLTDAETKALSEAIRSYGTGELLCVCAADAEHPEGRVEAVAPSVFVGYIDFASWRDMAQRRPVWEMLCQAMASMSTVTTD